MKHPAQILRSERGDLLIDSLVGAVISLLVMGAAAAVLFAATVAAVGSAGTTARQSLINTILSDAKPQISTYTDTPQTTNHSVSGETVPVTLWRETVTPGVSVLHAAVPKKSGAPAASCTDPTSLDPNICLTAATSATSSASGVAISSLPVTPVSGGFTFTAPAGAAELRYVFKATDVPGDSTLVFTNQDHTDVTYTVPVPSGQTGYYYGRVLVNGGAYLSLTTTGPAVYDQASMMIYEAPK